MAMPDRPRGTNGRAPLDPALDTFPKLARPERRALPRQGRHPREGLRHLAGVHLARSTSSEARLIALGLAALGFARGDKTAIVGDNRPAALLGDARHPGARRRARCRSTRTPSRRRCSTSSTTRRRASPWSRTRSRSTSSCTCGRGARASSTSSTTTPAGCGTTRTPGLLSLAALQERGAQVRARPPRLLRARRWPRARRTTSRSSATPRARPASPRARCCPHRNLIVTAPERHRARGPARDRRGRRLPAHGVGRRPHVLVRASRSSTGFTTNCPESAATVLHDLKEIGPTYFFAPPRIWESILTDGR